MSESYFIPAEAPLWQNEYVTNFFMVVEENTPPRPFTHSSLPPSHNWDLNDLLVVPLINADNTLLGFLTPDAPLDGLRPTLKTMALLELFANQAAVVIEGTRMYEEARRSSEERAALIEVGRLSSPDALHDLQAVYRTIYEQVSHLMPSDAFLISRYYGEKNMLSIQYLIDEGIEYPSEEYTTIHSRTRNLLYHAEVGCIFSTEQEYAAFTSDDPIQSNDIFGNGRPSQSLLFVPIRYVRESLWIAFGAKLPTLRLYTASPGNAVGDWRAGCIAITNARLNTELREALSRRRNLSALKTISLMTASHELRTPLTAVQGYLELLSSFYSAG